MNIHQQVLGGELQKLQTSSVYTPKLSERLVAEVLQVQALKNFDTYLLAFLLRFRWDD